MEKEVQEDKLFPVYSYLTFKKKLYFSNKF